MVQQVAWLLRSSANGICIHLSYRSLQAELAFPPPDIIFLNSILKISLHGKEILSWSPYLILKDILKEPPALFNSPQCLDKISPKWSPIASIAPSPFKYDWTFSSMYNGMVNSDTRHDAFIGSQQLDLVFDKKILQKNRDDPIATALSFLVYEDELGDMGKSVFSCRIRITTRYMFILTRSWLELPMQGIYRSIENRWMCYVDMCPPSFRHEFCIKELVNTNCHLNRENVDDVFRDAEAAKLDVIREHIKIVNFCFLAIFKLTRVAPMLFMFLPHWYQGIRLIVQNHY
ncbi:type 2a phosphatase regulator Tip41 [Mitosporidium daphniae]|uniref:Type 2a phosphatase regulator Tip41 n=1 Tax=Mitosporidium daphniae TaxID=1485682 RepID=A0A098VP12_9MICR|nr:type 2a phosphatase regulator Tip41 [Mitosporidium daphniae]KGG50539.1 type 2a phosphatase regulator Tip41 [Mitosporidium daphniae]|eukprot:XP_013236982.1 type 2a phosphatase regulator Tip41 [Mitosporidium daphniae]